MKKHSKSLRSLRSRTAAHGLSRRAAACVLALWIAGDASVVRTGAAEAPSSPAPPTSQIVEINGAVEYLKSGTDQWVVAGVRQALAPGDRVRTAKDGRAILQLSDRSVVRIGPSSVVEIQPPKESTGLRRFQLLRGLLFFINREKPSRIEFETPLVTGAIRGTEFALSVDGAMGATDLALFDGEVLLTSGGESMSVTGGKRVRVEPGLRPIVSDAPPASRLVQWALYYPAILDVDRLALETAETTQLQSSLAAYRTGDVRAAVSALPELPAVTSAAGKAYVAGLRLASGEFDAARALLGEIQGTAPGAALEALIRAVTFDTTATATAAAAGDASGLLAASYAAQSRGDLNGALASAKGALTVAPQFGLAWARVAELEFGFGRHREAEAAASKAATLVPNLASVESLRGFMALERGQAARAVKHFDQAIARDDAFATAWLGRALAQADLGRLKEAADDMQVAAALEPQRSLHRSAQGKIWSQQNEPQLAQKEWNTARRLDPADPTPWLYESLLAHRENRINDAVRSLETSVALNDSRRLYRSRLLLDRDQAVRSADLASLYQDAGLSDVARASAGQAVALDPLNSSAHLFLARSYGDLSSPQEFDLRYETPRQSELLVANLLAPRGGGNLSQLQSSQYAPSFIGPKPHSIQSTTEYRSQGDWSESATVFGQVDGLGYALDGQYLYRNGDQPNGWLERSYLSLQLKQEITPDDSLYFQISDKRNRAGDVARHWDPSAANTGFHVSETQEPNVIAGFHHAWSPNSHTLLLVSRLTDDFASTEPGATLPFVRRDFLGNPTQIETDALSQIRLQSEFTLQSVELQHLWQNDKHAFIVGGRFQSGAVESRAILSRGVTGVIADETQSGDLERGDLYGLYQWHVCQPLRLTAGLAYHHVEFPSNLDLAPLGVGQSSQSQVAPRAGLTLDLWKGGVLRGSFSRSLGGLYFEDAVRLEPVQMAGFVQTPRSLIPESVAALLPGAEFQTVGVGLDQQIARTTYFGVAVEELRSDGDRSVGALTATTPLPIPDATQQLGQALDYRERNLTAYVAQLIGKRWSVGARYRLSEALLDTRFTTLPDGLPGLAELDEERRAVLGDLGLFARFNHECGFFAVWETHWRHQSNQGYTPALGSEDFWQHDVTVGYRFLQRRAEASFSVLNLGGQDFRLNPLNYMVEPPRERTFVVRLRLLF